MGVSNPKNIGAHLFVQATAVAGVCQLQGNLPQSSTGSTVTSAAIDRQFIVTPAASLGSAGIGMAESCVLKNAFGAASGAPTTASIATVLQHCATSGGTYTAYTQPSGVAAALAADTTKAAGAHFQNVDLSGALRYLQTVTTVGFTGGASPAIIFTDEVVLGGLLVETGLPAVA